MGKVLSTYTKTKTCSQVGWLKWAKLMLYSSEKIHETVSMSVP